MHEEQEAKTKLTEIALQIRDWQLAREIPDSQLCKRFSPLGSTKTFKRILAGDLDELNVERQLHNYEQARALIESATAKEKIEEKDFPDLTHVDAARLAVTDALEEQGNNRLVIVEGNSGTGKTTIKRCLEERWPTMAIGVEADETWKESIINFLGALLRAVGYRERHGARDNEITLPNSAEARKLKLLDILKRRKRVLIIDEAHHLGVKTLNMVKTLINDSPTVIVFLAIPTLLRRLETTAYEEARQLTRNRLCERVHINGPCQDDTLKFLARRKVDFIDKKIAHACVEKLIEMAPQYGNWAFVNLVTRRARRAATKGPLDEEQFVEALTSVQRTR